MGDSEQAILSRHQDEHTVASMDRSPGARTEAPDARGHGARLPAAALAADEARGDERGVQEMGAAGGGRLGRREAEDRKRKGARGEECKRRMRVALVVVSCNLLRISGFEHTHCRRRDMLPCMYETGTVGRLPCPTPT